MLLNYKNVFFTEQENDSDSEGNDSDGGTTVCVSRRPVAATKRQSDKQTAFCDRDFSDKLKVSYNRDLIKKIGTGKT